MKSKFKNLIYFQNGSIGDFLMTIFFLENIRLNDNSIKLFVIIPKNEKLLLQFLERYPYINIILANRKSLRGLWGILKLSKFVFTKNLVITAPTPGFLFSYIKMMAKSVALHPQSQLVGFEDGQKINKFIYTKLLKYNTKIIYPNFLKSIIEELGFEIKKEVPKLEYEKDENILEELGLEKENYIVFHPIAATKGRSLKEKEIMDLIKKINQIFSEIKIVLTGGDADKDALNVISLLLKNVVVLITPKISELCVIIDNTKLFIGVDTGTSHLASFLQKKSLIIAQNGTPNWLPYYNPNAIILYFVENCSHQIYEGKDHLEKCRGERFRCLGYVPMEIIEKYLEKMLI